MTIKFLKFVAKNAQLRHFLSQIQAFLFFDEVLLLNKFESANFIYDNVVFKFQPTNSQIIHFGSQIQAFLFFHKIVQIYKFEGAEFKYSNSFFTILYQKCPNKAFFVKNTQISHFGSEIEAFLFFHEVLQRDKFEITDFKYGKIVSKFMSKKYKSGIFCSKYRHFCFFVKFCKQTNLTVLISNMRILFLNFCPKNTQIRHFLFKYTQIKHFCSQIQAILFFRQILQLD